MNDLSALELEIQQGLDSSAEIVFRVGSALAKIRDDKLYKQSGYRSFEKYVLERFSMSRSRAYHLISAAQVIEDLRPHFKHSVLPKNESVVRPLMKFPKQQRVDIWGAVLAAHPDPRREDVLSIAQSFS
jgi:hypothetical protein